SSYTLVQADIGSTLTVTVTAANCNGSITSVATATVTKATQTAPDAPTLADRTSTSITLNVMENCEFRMNDEGWQISTLFSSLFSNTTYVFVARKIETATHFASDPSLPVQFTTESDSVGIRNDEFANVKVYSYQNTVYINVGVENFQPLRTVEIMDMMGRLIHKTIITDIETAITLQVASGIYNVRLISQKGNFTIRKVSINNQ
ncbi:MAG: T9SS type A sorting domain-containing protein, partial [Bacteroidetes bacterium]|nr:T9SS type A sorting domain-containing protein [Bacteroidota bacterium]MCL2303366.1 T9SS type A sorting domain-containing protein [Lentimicrobiaceae bacterium]